MRTRGEQKQGQWEVKREVYCNYELRVVENEKG